MASLSTSESGSASAQKETVMNLANTPGSVAVLGTGMYGRALATLLRESAGLDVRVGSRTPRGDQMTSAAAVEDASVVFLAVPPHVHGPVLNTIASNLRPDTILVDISNHPLNAPPRQHATSSVAEKLQGMAPAGVHVAKAFNTLSSYHLEDTRRSHTVRIACDDMDSVDNLSLVCARAGLTPVYEGKLSEARNLEKLPHRLFPTWRFPIIVSVVVLAWWYLYNTLAGFVILGGRDPTTPSREWRKWPLETFMSATGEAAMTMFALTFIPGPVAGIVQLFRKSASKPFGKFFGTWLDARKELGLAAFFYASWHAIAGTVVRAHLNSETSNWKEYGYFTLGIISYSLFALLAIGSSPGVAESMSWREFRALFSWIGTLGLAFGVLHQGFWGWILHKHRPNPSFWVGGGKVMPSYWLGIIIPLVALGLRFITWSPFAVGPLRKLRNEIPVDLRSKETVQHVD